MASGLPRKGIPHGLKPALILLALMSGLRPWPTSPACPKVRFFAAFEAAPFQCKRILGPKELFAAACYTPPLPRSLLMASVIAPSTAPATVISRPEDHQQRTVMRDLAARELPAAASPVPVSSLYLKAPISARPAAPARWDVVGRGGCCWWPSLSWRRCSSLCRYSGCGRSGGSCCWRPRRGFCGP